MGATERNRKFIADLASHGTRLNKAEVMSVGRLPSADQARLRAHKPKVILVAVANGLRKRLLTGDPPQFLVSAPRKRPGPHLALNFRFALR